MKNEKKLSLVLVVGNCYQKEESNLNCTLQWLAANFDWKQTELLIGLKRKLWDTIPLFCQLEFLFPKDSYTLFEDENSNNIASFYNLGANLACSNLLMFIWSGCLPNYEEVSGAIKFIENNNLDWFAGLEESYCQQFGLTPIEIRSKFTEYFLSCGRIFPLCEAVVKKDHFLRMGGFNPSLILKEEFDIEFWHRSVISKSSFYFGNGSFSRKVSQWDDFISSNSTNNRFTHYMAHSYRLYSAHDINNREDETSILKRFRNDLPIPELQLIDAIDEGLHFDTQDNDEDKHPLKIAVTGNKWEFIHNRLCFFNYFSFLEGSGNFTYIPLLDALVKPEIELRGVDVVIISRGMHQNVVNILEFCQKHNIPTIYMIDDNWLSIANDWPDPYKDIFSPGLPVYEVFIKCITQCDAVLLYNPILETDIKKYARKVIRIPVNVKKTDFSGSFFQLDLRTISDSLQGWRIKTNGLIIGYVGSARNVDPVFQALADASKAYSSKVKILLFGAFSQNQLSMFNNNSCVKIEHVSYDEYASFMGALKPDILISPLESCHTSMSKCPNKYLEYSIVGAAGIYSNIPPYSLVIQDKINGLLINDLSYKAWLGAITTLIENDDLRLSISREAQADVLSTFETSVVAPQFIKAISSMVNNLIGR